MQRIGPSISPIVIEKYHTAREDDSSKVLILAKVCARDAEASAHLESVSPEHKYRKYSDARDLPRLVQDSIAGWISRRAVRASRGVTKTKPRPQESVTPSEDLGEVKTGIGYRDSPRLQEYDEELKAALYQAVQEHNVENSRRKLAGEPLLPENWLDNRIQTLQSEVHKRYPPWIESAVPTEEDRRIADRYRMIPALHAKGPSDREIAKQLGITKRVVRKVLRPDEESLLGGDW